MERASHAAISPAASGQQANYTFPLTIVTALFFVAEGVEDEAQRNLLVQGGCTLMQGFLLGRPLPMVEFESLYGAARVGHA